MQVDMSATVAFREAMLGQWEQQYSLRISLNKMITKAVVVALRRSHGSMPRWWTRKSACTTV